MTAQAWNTGEPPRVIQTVQTQPENTFTDLVSAQDIAIVDHFPLESGATLHNVPVAYTTRGTLNETASNALVICHALSGSADVADWWGPLLGGPGQAFDTSRFYVVCLNSLGSPYGSASPMTYKDGDEAQGRYGPEFPLTTVRDDVNIHKVVLDHLGVKKIASVVGGSMGGMLALEYAYFGPEYVRCIAPIATAATHSAWGISWGEAQRQSIYSDPKYDDGYYPLSDPPMAGLGAARMAALLTYRSRDSFETRFGRNTPDIRKAQSINSPQRAQQQQDSNEHWSIHNHGHFGAKGSRQPTSRPGTANGTSSPQSHDTSPTPTITDPQFAGTTQFPISTSSPSRQTLTGASRPNTASHYFSAQSYLRYQAQKFTARFDANCYIAITRKLDTHDLSRHRASSIHDALQLIQQPALVLGIESDGLFTFAEQKEIADGIKDSRLRKIDSQEGHDAFLLQFEQVNRYLLEFFREVLPDIMEKAGAGVIEEGATDGVKEMTKTSTFGEAEVGDLTAW